MVGNNEFDYSFKQTQFSFLKKAKTKKNPFQLQKLPCCLCGVFIGNLGEWRYFMSLT